MSYISEQEHRTRVPAAIISGFLGSGKTTLINAILRDPRFARTAVAINEFGEVPIDQHLIDHGDDQTIVMANGCLCCNLAGDMEEAVMRVFGRSEQGEIPSFDRLIVEPSGLSDPAPIAQALLRQPVLSRAFSLHPLLVTIDAALILSQLDRHSEVRKQIELADTIVVTKVDLVEPTTAARVIGELKVLNPSAKVHQVSRGQIDPTLLFSSSFYDLEAGAHPVSELLCLQSHVEEDRGASEQPHIDTHGHDHASVRHGDVVSVSLTANVPLPWRPLEEWLRDIRIRNGGQLLRIKGLINTRGLSRPMVIQAVEHVQSVPVQLRCWPSSDHRTRIVMIGRGLDVAGIRESWSTFCTNVVAFDMPALF